LTLSGNISGTVGAGARLTFTIVGDVEKEGKSLGSVAYNKTVTQSGNYDFSFSDLAFLPFAANDAIFLIDATAEVFGGTATFTLDPGVGLTAHSSATPVPEPACVTLLGIGAVALFGYGRLLPKQAARAINRHAACAVGLRHEMNTSPERLAI
jgi:hypothetical protein